MKVKLIYENLKRGHVEQVVELQSCITEEDIESLFPLILGTRYNGNCSYEVLEGEVTTIEEALAYTE